MSEVNVEFGEPESVISGARQAVLVPQRCTLSGFVFEAGCSEGIAIQSLAPGTEVIVRTRNSLYRLMVLDGGRHRVLVEGGTLFPAATHARLQGASAGGSFVRTGWIGVGLRVELWVGPNRIVTSPVRSVTIENRTPRPYTFQ